ncbi:MAG: RIP metalloprotease RseP, partial [Acidobacteria bacterium]|nr:RIP metalloprotease RseP [Acidobacteriota bacterium]
MLTILAFIVVLGITITVHEFGHFAMAKLLKIRVLVFSLGFGPRLVGFTRGGTEYRLSPFPIGGYVKMAG